MAHFDSVVIKNSDMGYGSFIKSLWLASEWKNCNMSMCNFSWADLGSMRFVNCNEDMAQFSDQRLGTTFF